MAYQLPLTADQVVQFHGEIVNYAGVRAIVTAGTIQVPTVYQFTFNDNSEFWKLRARGVSENDDGVAFLLPNDYNALTNNVIWCRIG